MRKIFKLLVTLIVALTFESSLAIENSGLCQALFSPQIGADSLLVPMGPQSLRKHPKDVTISPEMLDVISTAVIDHSLILSSFHNFIIMEYVNSLGISLNEFLMRYAKAPENEQNEYSMIIFELMRDHLQRALDVFAQNEAGDQFSHISESMLERFGGDPWVASVNLEKYNRDELLQKLAELGIHGKSDIHEKLQVLNEILDHRKKRSAALSLVRQSLPQLGIGLRISSSASWLTRQVGKVLSLPPKGIISLIQSGEFGKSLFMVGSIFTSASPFLYQTFTMAPVDKFHTLIFWPLLASWYFVPYVYTRLPGWKDKLRPKFAKAWRSYSRARKLRRIRKVLKRNSISVIELSKDADQVIESALNNLIADKIVKLGLGGGNLTDLLYNHGDLENSASFELMTLVDLLKLSLSLDGDLNKELRDFLFTSKRGRTRISLSGFENRLIEGFKTEVAVNSENAGRLTKSLDKLYVHVQSLYERFAEIDKSTLSEHDQKVLSERLELIGSVRMRLLAVSYELFLVQERIEQINRSLKDYDDDKPFVSNLGEIFGGRSE